MENRGTPVLSNTAVKKKFKPNETRILHSKKLIKKIEGRSTNAADVFYLVKIYIFLLSGFLLLIYLLQLLVQ